MPFGDNQPTMADAEHIDMMDAIREGDGFGKADGLAAIALKH